MKKSKLFVLLNALNKKEMTRFSQFVHSPYFNKHKEVQLLVSHLAKCYPVFDDKRVGAKFLYILLFGKRKPFKQAQLALVFTYTIRLVEQFLVIEELKNQSTREELLLLQGLNSKKCERIFESKLTKIQQRLSQATIQDSYHLANLFEVSQEADRYYTLTERRAKDPNLSLTQEYLDYYYMAEKLKIAVEMVMRQGILNVQFSKELLNNILQAIDNGRERFSAIPSIYMYYKLYQMLTSFEEESYYFAALEYLRDNGSHFEKEERRNLFNYFQNYCIKKINSNQGNFMAELFELYKLLLSQKLLLDNIGQLSEWHYKNIATVALRLGHIDWSYSFLEEYKNLLPLENARNAYTFNLAAWYHVAQQYDKVLELLLQVEYVDLRYNVGAKALLLRTYYEIEAFDALQAHITTFRKYVHRNQIMNEDWQYGYSNLFKYTGKLAQIRERIPFTNLEKTTAEIEKLNLAVEAEKNIFNKKWLLEKILIMQTKFPKS